MKGCDKANTVVTSRLDSVTASRAVKSLFMAKRDCSYYVDLKPECKNFTHVVVSLQEISNQTLDNTEAHQLHHTDHHPSSPPPQICTPMYSSSHFTRQIQLYQVCKDRS